MGDRPDKTVVLQNGAAAHTLDDAARARKQGGIHHAEHGVGAVGIPVNAVDLHLKLLGIFPLDGGEDGGRARRELADLHRARAESFAHVAEDADLGILLHRSQDLRQIGYAVQLPGRARRARVHGDDLRLRDTAFAQRHGKPGRAVVDAVAECAEDAAVRVAEGEGADAVESVAQQDPQHGPPFLADGGLYREIQGLLAAPDLQLYLIPGTFQRRNQRGCVCDGCPVSPADEVAGLEPRVFGGRHGTVFGLHRAEARHDHAVSADLDADRLPAYQQFLRESGRRSACDEKQGAQPRHDSFSHQGCLPHFFHTNHYVRGRQK